MRKLMIIAMILCAVISAEAIDSSAVDSLQRENVKKIFEVNTQIDSLLGASHFPMSAEERVKLVSVIDGLKKTTVTVKENEYFKNLTLGVFIGYTVFVFIGGCSCGLMISKLEGKKGKGKRS